MGGAPGTSLPDYIDMDQAAISRCYVQKLLSWFEPLSKVWNWIFFCFAQLEAVRLAWVPSD